MRVRSFIVLVVAAVVMLGCSAAQLKAHKDASWNYVPRGLADGQDPNLLGYGHPLRPVAFLAHPIGVALDYVLVRPFYMLAGLAPEWFGLTAEDAQLFHDHYWELVTPENAPRRWE
jgi:hypothetical protein